MKKGNLPTQEYELINVCMQTVESGTPLTCDDCGRTIFNIATIKGKSDGKTYNVGLSCVKKLLKKRANNYTFTLYRYKDGETFCIELESKNGWQRGHTAALSLDKLPLFSEFVKA